MSIIFAISGTYQLSIGYTNYVAVVSSNIYSKHCAFKFPIFYTIGAPILFAHNCTFSDSFKRPNLGSDIIAI